MVCPLGAPHGFSDTWGATRSGGRSHQGVDMFAAQGTPEYAADDGTVRISSSALGGLSIHLTSDRG
jgi:murein DD-endopeptidase MepM/ murein hydrolase activator NlpD